MAKKGSADPEVIASDVGAYLEQKAELEAAYARIKELMAEAEKEEVRWQERIAAVITSAGLTPIDASGNESGDPLDWTADQVAAALGELNAAADESRAHDGALSAFSPEQRAELEKPIARAPAPIEVEHALTAEQKSRAKHPSTSGHCRRCGIAVKDNYGRCPPGFWMNKRESALWDDGVRFSEC